MTSTYKRESVGMGYDYSECVSDDEDALMDTTTDSYIGYTSYRCHLYKSQTQSTFDHNMPASPSDLESTVVESKGPESVSPAMPGQSMPKRPKKKAMRGYSMAKNLNFLGFCDVLDLMALGIAHLGGW